MPHEIAKDQMLVPLRDSKKRDKSPSLSQRLERAIELFDHGNNLSAALQEFIALIDAGCDEAYYFVGCIYEEGAEGVERDLSKALFYYKKSVNELGYVEGCLALGRFYYYGIGTAKDYSAAFNYYLAVADRIPNPIAQMMVGRMYLLGQGIEKNLVKAKNYLVQAVASDNVYAIRDLALLEEERGHRVRGWLLRLKAGFMAFRIGRKNMRDIRLRAG